MPTCSVKDKKYLTLYCRTFLRRYKRAKPFIKILRITKITVHIRIKQNNRLNKEITAQLSTTATSHSKNDTPIIELTSKNKKETPQGCLFFTENIVNESVSVIQQQVLQQLPLHQ